MFSITLQNNFDNQITANDTVGQLQFAAPYEFDGGAAVDIVAKIYANGEGGFQSSSNPTSIIIATAAADASAAVDRLKVSEDGHFLPVTNNTYDLGSSSLNFKNSYISEGVVLASNTPSVTTNKLFYDGSTLRWDANDIIDSSMISDGLEWKPISNAICVANLTTTEFSAATLVIESEGIASNDNDTTIPTSAAVRDYVDTQDAAISGYAEAISGGGGGTPGGADTNVQYNNAGSFGGESDFTYNATTNTLTVPTGVFESVRFSNADGNVFVGQVNRTTQDYNVMIGHLTGDTDLFIGNIGIGYRTLNTNLSSFSSYNTCIGYQSKYSSQGSYNVGVGYETLYATNAASNIALGTRALAANNADGCIEITTRYGNSDNSGAGGTDRVLNIGHTIFGDMTNRKIRIGMSGVTTSYDANPDATLEVLPEATTDLVLLAKGTNGQTGNLFECRDASDTSLVSIDPNGKLYPAKGIRTNWLSSSGGGASKNFDLNDSASFSHTLATNTTLSVSNGGAGSRFTIALVQDATGSRTVTWWSNIKWPGGLEPTLTTTANKTDVFGFVEYSAGNYYGFVIGYGL